MEVAIPKLGFDPTPQPVCFITIQLRGEEGVSSTYGVKVSVLCIGLRKLFPELAKEESKHTGILGWIQQSHA